MKRTLGSACLVAGTAIGAGVMALPMTFAALGILPTALLMIAVWAVMHYSSLINLELNLRAGDGLPLGALGRLFSGPKAEWLGTLSLLVLMNALLAAYLYGLGSVLQSFLHTSLGIDVSKTQLTTAATLCLGGALLLPTAKVDAVNRVLFIALVAIFTAVIAWLLSHMEPQSLPWILTPSDPLKVLRIALPVVFTSFGFQVIFHTLTRYCNKNPLQLKRAFFWGSLTPLILYVLWTVCVLSVVATHRPDVYGLMQQGTLDVGGLVEALAELSANNSLKAGSWMIMILAIATSAIGVGLGLADSWRAKVTQHTSHRVFRHAWILSLTLLPAYAVAVGLPGAFIKTLSFAGMILVVIALGLPLYLLHASDKLSAKVYYPLVRHRGLRLMVALFGTLIMAAEIWNMLG
ncbi:MAG: amino acid permease [Holosporales bacterium]